MTKKNLVKMIATGISGSMALLPFMGLNIQTMGFSIPGGEVVLPIMLGITSLMISALFLKYVKSGGKIGYYFGVCLSSSLIFSVIFSLIINFLKYQSFPFEEVVAGITLAGMGTIAFWPYVLIALGSFIASDLLIEKFVK